ncbi:ATP-binding protein [Megalodesulfovibrio paquesii]
MREVVVLSGKGGTGKTSVTAAFAHLARKSILCDLDVDAPDLHLLLQPSILETEDFISGEEPHIDPQACTGCGICRDSCAYEAIAERDGQFVIDPFRCEGCMVCQAVCPARAVSTTPRHCGVRHLSSTRFGPMVHARLFPGQENSGRLVALLRKQAREVAAAHCCSLIISDGSPGIGCPVISSLTGASMAVIVSEPTPSGRHDLERVAALCAHFRIPAGVIINKYDLNPQAAMEMAVWCRGQGHRVLAYLPFDDLVVRAMRQGRAVTECPPAAITPPLAEAWNHVETMLETILPAGGNPRAGGLQERLK